MGLNGGLYKICYIVYVHGNAWIYGWYIADSRIKGNIV